MVQSDTLDHSQRKERVMFTGDTIALDTPLLYQHFPKTIFNRTSSVLGSKLTGFKAFNHGNIQIQEESIRMLASETLPFTWILPAHGRMIRFESVEDKKRSLLAAADYFHDEDATEGFMRLHNS